MRGVPDLVLMLLLFYSIQIWLNDLTDLLGWDQIDIDPFVAGVAVLGFIYGAYFTETFRGAFLAVPRGQLEAGAAYGMTPWQVFSRIMFPQMMRFALPGIGNNWQVMVKATALVSIIGLADVVKASQDAGKGTLRFFFFTLLAGGDLSRHHHSVQLRADVAGKALLDRRAEGGSMIDDHPGILAQLSLHRRLPLHRPRHHAVAAGRVDRARLLPVDSARGRARVEEQVALGAGVAVYVCVSRHAALRAAAALLHGPVQPEIIRNHALLNAFFRDGMHCTLLAFTLNTCAYTTEIFAGAIKATPYGEIEAARAYGMSSFTLYRRVILPSALRRALPYYSNEVILMLHATTVAFTATVPDILKIARDVNSATYQSFKAFGIAALLYLCISFALVWLFRRAERRWLAYLRPQGK